MIETSGAVPILEATRALALLVALPLAWALACAGARKRAAILAPLASALTCAVALVVLARTWGAIGRGHAGTIEHVATIARLGSLDLRVDLVADARSALLATTASLLGLAIVATELAGKAPSSRRLGWAGALTAGVVLAVLGDGLGPMIAGAQLATLSTFALIGGGRVRSLLVATAGDGALVLAACLLFWGLGGTFGSSGFAADQGPRAALVTTSEPAPDKRATLVVVAHGGARVTSDRDTPLPGEPLEPPFVTELEPGIVSFRVRLGPASPDVLATNVSLAPGRTHVLVPLGPTTSLREVAERMRLAVPDAVRDVLAARSLGPLPLPVVLAILFSFALVARLALLISARDASPVAAVASLVTVDLAVRSASVVGAAGAVLAEGGAVSALLCALLAARIARHEPGVATAQGAVVAAIASTSLVAAGAGEPGAAIAIGIAAALGTSAMTTAPRWPSVAAGVSVGLLPVAGASAGLVTASAALVIRALGQEGVGAGLWWGALVVLVCALCLASVAARWSLEGERDEGARGEASPWVGHLVLATTLLAVASGPVLSVGAHLLAGARPALVDRLVGASAFWPAARSPAASPPLAVSIAAVVLVTAAAGIGWGGAARIVRSSVVTKLAPRVRDDIVSAIAGLAAATRVMVRGVAVLEREVIEDAGSALVAGARRAASLLGRARVPFGEPPRSVLDRLLEAALARVGLDDPRTSARLRDVTIVLGVALPVLLVLSSWLLG